MHAAVAAALLAVSLHARPPAKVFELRAVGGHLRLVEQASAGRPAPLVVGQVVRVTNGDVAAHAVTLTGPADARAVATTGIIAPGGYRNVVLDIDLYSRAGGRPAGAVTLQLRCEGEPTAVAPLDVVSAARRGSLSRVRPGDPRPPL